MAVARSLARRCLSGPRRSSTASHPLPGQPDHPSSSPSPRRKAASSSCYCLTVPAEASAHESSSASRMGSRRAWRPARAARARTCCQGLAIRSGTDALAPCRSTCGWRGCHDPTCVSRCCCPGWVRCSTDGPSWQPASHQSSTRSGPQTQARGSQMRTSWILGSGTSRDECVREGQYT